MRTKTTSRATILPFRKRLPVENLFFERIDLDPLSAFFRATHNDVEYLFSLTQDLELFDACTKDSGILLDYDIQGSDDPLLSLIRAAKPIAEEQFRIWLDLTARARIRLLISWGDDQILRAESDLHRLLTSGLPRDRIETVQLLAKDIEVFDAHLKGLETALLAMDD